MPARPPTWCCPSPPHTLAPLRAAGEPPQKGPAVLGLLRHGAGKVGLYGDSSCLDSSHSKSRCFGLLSKMLQFAAGEVRRAWWCESLHAYRGECVEQTGGRMLLRSPCILGRRLLPNPCLPVPPVVCFAALHRCAQESPELLSPAALLAGHFGTFEGLPQRRPEFNFTEVSPVLNNAIRWVGGWVGGASVV